MNNFFRIKVVFDDGGTQRYVGYLPNEYVINEARARVFSRLELIGYIEMTMGIQDIREYTIIPVPGYSDAKQKEHISTIWR